MGNLAATIAQECLHVIEQIRHGKFSSTRELRQMEGQRALLHQQLVEILGYSVNMKMARQLAARSR